MTLSTQPYKGSRDFYPTEMRVRRWMFGEIRKVLESYGYLEYDGPLLEPFELYAAKTGDEVVNQQLYSFVDRGDRKVAIRPEMTPTLARMVAAQINELPKPIRWYCIPNFWRYERPQRGRLREFWQLNADVLGGDPLQADAELIGIACALMKKFGGAGKVSIRVNHRGLTDFVFNKKMGLAGDVANKASKLVDARPKLGEAKFTQAIKDLGISVDQQETLEQFFSLKFKDAKKVFACPAMEQLEKLFGYLRESGWDGWFEYDPSILRGLDYYTGTVFEIFDVSPENPRAIFGGGRYDNLMALFGKQPLSGVGFGMGDVTLQNFLETHQLIPQFEEVLDVYVAVTRDQDRAVAEKISSELRAKGKKTVTSLGADGFGVHLKAAVKLGARYAVLLGERELAEGKVVVKDLKANSQKEVAIAEVHTACAISLTV